ncbi:hypothetical protein S40285_07495 [Stachybotrys chlorohalonatus IBT 40285]|uniref:Stc1 domain-containing protein n=1 Tax=Stachybotrys chlorohalonatus (strain IBT 40285) TaxID=1283841 RepID=A0A084QJG1_STAC4|nr:hypothetical protein S40285_07495 [Stachybotrys chlorohalonata IBT 40285]
MPGPNRGGGLPKANRTMPTKFRCKVGGEWKPWDAFSSNQQKVFMMQWDRGSATTSAAQSGMTCREHSTNCRDFVRCDVCKLTLPRHKFSKNSLKEDVIRCEACTAWGEVQEEGVTPAPLLTGHISPEEHNGSATGDWYDVLAGETKPQTPITDLSELGLTAEEQALIDSDTELRGLLSRTAKSKNSAKSSQYGAGPRSESSGRSFTSVASISGASTTSYLPPHLKRAGPNSISTATTLREQELELKQENKVGYNAWDSSGTKHQATKTWSNPVPSDQASLLDEMTTSLADMRAGGSMDDEWPELNAVSAQASASRNSSAKPGRKTKWHKPITLSMAELRKIGGEPQVVSHMSSDVDDQRRFTYLDRDEHEEF